MSPFLILLIVILISISSNLFISFPHLSKHNSDQPFRKQQRQKQLRLGRAALQK